MIQRKQTIYLLLALICALLLLFYPIFSLSAVSFGKVYEGSFGAKGIQGEDYTQAFPMYILFSFMAFLSVAGIALFRNRKKQLLICRINLIIHILIGIGLTVFYYVGKGLALDRLEENGFSNPEFAIDFGFFFAVAAIPFLILAIRGIRGDEKLLKSIDRIR
jgi:uncharacterized membrane protein